jgi:hypothetical protein
VHHTLDAAEIDPGILSGHRLEALPSSHTTDMSASHTWAPDAVAPACATVAAAPASALAAPASPSVLVSSLVEQLTAPIPPPIIKTPKLRKPRRHVQTVHMRRSGRPAMKSHSRINNPELQVKRVLMKKLEFNWTRCKLIRALSRSSGKFSMVRSRRTCRKLWTLFFPKDGYNGPTLLDMES